MEWSVRDRRDMSCRVHKVREAAQVLSIIMKLSEDTLDSAMSLLDSQKCDLGYTIQVDYSIDSKLLTCGFNTFIVPYIWIFYMIGKVNENGMLINTSN